MINLFCLMSLSCLLASLVTKLNKAKEITKSNHISKKTLLVAIILILSLFSGLRTRYNDTYTYIHAFNLIKNETLNFSILFQPYGGYETLQIFMKTYVSTNPQILLLLVSFFINNAFVTFFEKYSKNFVLTILCYFIIGPYVFSMAGMKQAISMAISLFAIESLLENNLIKFVIKILVASLFHPYIICLLILPLLKNNVWNYRFILLIFVIILTVLNLDVLISIASIIGKDYTLDEIIGHTINPFRVIIEMIPVFFSYIARKSIRKEEDVLFNLGVNMMCINSLMILMGLFFNPIYFGRIGTYFSIMNAIILPKILDILYDKSQNGKLNKLIVYSLFLIYFVLDMTKLGSISIFEDIFKHVSLFSLL